MAHFRILEEVRTGQAGDWQLCFHFGVYEYDPDQNTDVPSQEGYRFIWRRPNGQLQGARGQARLEPRLITMLLGKAAEAGWYPDPPVRQGRPGAHNPRATHRSLTVYTEGQTSEHAGAGGMFQIVEVRENDREIDRPVDHGIHFSDVAEVERYLAQEVFPGDEIDVTLEDS